MFFQLVLCWCWMLCPELLKQPTQVEKWSSSFSSPSCFGFKASCHVLCSISPEGVCISHHARMASVVYTDQALGYWLVTCHLPNAHNFSTTSMGCALLWTQFVCCCCYVEEHPGFGAPFFAKTITFFDWQHVESKGSFKKLTVFSINLNKASITHHQFK